jgi:uncharacterized protein (TIGR02996 family)
MRQPAARANLGAALNERDTLLTAVLTTPDDDTARLVFADWLEEHGEPAFGRFLRAGVVAAKYRHAGVIEDREFFDAAQVLADVCGSGEPGRWVAALGLGPSPAVRGDWLWDSTGDRMTLRAGNTAAVFGRGMLDALTVTLAEWYDAAERAVRSWPVSLVDVRDVPGLAFTVGFTHEFAELGREPGWRVRASFAARPHRVRGWSRRLIRPLPGDTLPAPVMDRDAERWFPTRGDMVAGIAAALPGLVEELRERVGGTWPG